MRKGVLGLSLVLSLSLTPAYSATPPKAGSTCSKQGITKTYKGKIYKCKKVKGKLVWSKGKVVKQAAPISSAVPTPTPTPTPTPSPTPTPTPTIFPSPNPLTAEIDTKFYAWNFRINALGTLERRRSDSNDWTSESNRPGQYIHPIRMQAFNEIKAYQESTSIEKVTTNFYFAPNVKADVVATFKKYFEKSINFYSSEIPPGSTLEVLIATEMDDSFRRTTLQSIFELEFEANDFYSRSTEMFHQFDIPNPLNSSGGGSLSGTSIKGKYLYLGAVCSCFSGENLLMYNVPHEVTHFYQFAKTPTIPKQNFSGKYPNLVEGRIYIPSSLVEGSANTLGSAILVDYAGWYSDMMDWHLGRYKRLGLLNSISSVQESIKLFGLSESYLPEKTGYADINVIVGQLQFEYFIATYGMKAYVNLFQNIQKFGEFELGLQKTISKTKYQFYTESAEYVMESYNRVTL